VRLSGRAGAILWGYREAAIVTAWTIGRAMVQGQPVRTLTATIAQAAPFALRQTPLLFSVKHERGFLVFPLLEPPRIEAARLTARLGPPEG
jgi:hypothetical protein